MFSREYTFTCWDELYLLDLRRYQPVWLDHVLAMRIGMHGATGELPFQLLPALGGSVMFRGWFLGRLRDKVLLAQELEYRAPLTERWADRGRRVGLAGRNLELDIARYACAQMPGTE